MKHNTVPETGLIYLRAHYYDPATAQFLTPDPLFAITGERYTYAGNDPINGSDPTGLCGFLGNGPCTPGGIAKEVTNDTVKVATHGHANCIRGATCARSTPAAFVSNQHAADFAGGVLNGVTGGLAKDFLPGTSSRVNLRSGYGRAGQGIGVGSSLVMSSGNIWIARLYGVMSTAGTCLSGARIGYCIAAGAVNGVGVGVGVAGLPWSEIGSAPQGEITVIADFLSIWPSIIADEDMHELGGGC